MLPQVPAHRVGVGASIGIGKNGFTKLGFRLGPDITVMMGAFGKLSRTRYERSYAQSRSIKDEGRNLGVQRFSAYKPRFSVPTDKKSHHIDRRLGVPWGYVFFEPAVTSQFHDAARAAGAWQSTLLFVFLPGAPTPKLVIAIAEWLCVSLYEALLNV